MPVNIVFVGGRWDVAVFAKKKKKQQLIYYVGAVSASRIPQILQYLIALYIILIASVQQDSVLLIGGGALVPCALIQWEIPDDLNSPSRDDTHVNPCVSEWFCLYSLPAWPIAFLLCFIFQVVQSIPKSITRFFKINAVNFLALRFLIFSWGSKKTVRIWRRP